MADKSERRIIRVLMPYFHFLVTFAGRNCCRIIKTRKQREYLRASNEILRKELFGKRKKAHVS